MPVLVANHSESEAAGWLGAAGILVGPSTGNLYAGDKGRGYGGIGLRVLGTVLFAAAAASYETGSYCLFFCDGNGGLALAGLGVLVGSTVWNFATISNSVERHNQRVRDGVKIAPAVDPQNGGSGLRLSVRF